MLRILRVSRPVRAAQRSVLVKLPVRSLATKPNTVVITDKAASTKVESTSELSGLDVPEVDDDADPAEADREFAFSMFGRELDELASKDLTPPDLSGYDPERVKEMDAIARKLADRFLGVVRTETAAESAPPRKAPRVAVMTAENMHQHELFEGRYLKSTKATKATESAPQAEAAEVDDPTDDVTDESIIEQLADSDGKMDGLEIESSAESIRSGMRSTERREIVLNEDDLEETFVRSSGPGGQCVNRRSTCVNLFHKPTATRIKCQITRSQQQNRRLAREILKRELDAIVNGKQSASEVERSKVLKQKNRNARRHKQREALKAAASVSASAAVPSKPETSAVESAEPKKSPTALKSGDAAKNKALLDSLLKASKRKL